MRSASKSPRRPSSRLRGAALALLGALASGWATTVTAQDLYVICNASVTLRGTEVRELFTGEKNFAGKVRLLPADNLATQEAFLDKVLKLNATKYASLWTKKAFRDGSNPPLLKSNDAEALAFVLQTPGACSYVAAAPPATVAVVARF